MSSIIGWDVGGAHLKAALVEDGRLAKVVQLPCELWRGMDRLEIALDQATAGSVMRSIMPSPPPASLSTTSPTASRVLTAS